MTVQDHYVIVQFSDLHVVPDDVFKAGIRPLENLDRAIGRLICSDVRPDVILLTGDLTDRGDSESYEALRAKIDPLAKRFGSAVIYLPGNHDSRGAFRESLLDETPSNEPIYQVISVGSLRIVALDSSIPGEVHGVIDDGQLRMLEEELKTASTSGTIVALHHPPLWSPVSKMNGYGLREPERLGNVLRGSDVMMVLSGHNHHVSCGAISGIPVFVAPACAYQLDVLVEGDELIGLRGSAFSRIDVSSGSAIATLVPVSGDFARLA